MATLKELFPKGQVVVAVDTPDWVGIVYASPRKQYMMPDTRMGVEVFGYAHEMGDVYVREYAPTTLEYFHDVLKARTQSRPHIGSTALGEPQRYFKGKLTEDGFHAWHRWKRGENPSISGLAGAEGYVMNLLEDGQNFNDIEEWFWDELKERYSLKDYEFNALMETIGGWM